MCHDSISHVSNSENGWTLNTLYRAHGQGSASAIFVDSPSACLRCETKQPTHLGWRVGEGPHDALLAQDDDWVLFPPQYDSGRISHP